MRTVKIATTAEVDLQEIWEYAAQHNTQAANNLIKQLAGKFALLRDNPFIGREQDRLLVNLRSFATKDYVIFYQPFEDRIEVLRVLHTARDIEGVFDHFLDSL